MTQISIWFTPTQLAWIKQQALTRKVSDATIVRDAVLRAMDPFKDQPTSEITAPPVNQPILRHRLFDFAQSLQPGQPITANGNECVPSKMTDDELEAWLTWHVPT